MIRNHQSCAIFQFVGLRLLAVAWVTRFAFLLMDAQPVGGNIRGGFRYSSVFIRYLEVMLLMTLAMVTVVIIVFFAFGMMANANGTQTIPPSLFIVLGLLLTATIPGWKMMRWYYRWPVYAISLLIVYGLAVK